MLGQIMPGMRHVRTPLVVGALWLLVVWLAVGRNWPDRSAASGLWADVYRLATSVGQPLVLAALAFAAYVVGARAQWLLGLLQTLMRKLAGPRSPRWWRRVILPRPVWPELEKVAAAMADRYPEPELNNDGKEMRQYDFRAAMDIAMSSAGFRWPAEAPDLYQEFDRRESERDFSYGIALPLGILAITLYVVEPAWFWASIVLAILALLSKSAGSYQHRELERFVLEAVLVGRVHAQELTDLLTDWTERSGDVLPFNLRVQRDEATIVEQRQAT